MLLVIVLVTAGRLHSWQLLAVLCMQVGLHLTLPGGIRLHWLLRLVAVDAVLQLLSAHSRSSRLLPAMASDILVLGSMFVLLLCFGPARQHAKKA
jgi:ABC-type nickel/cobalt efflux system permease component RcnA